VVNEIYIYIYPTFHYDCFLDFQVRQTQEQQNGAASAVTVLLTELSGLQIPVEAVDISLTKSIQTVFCDHASS
jgi:hypothetical protein